MNSIERQRHHSPGIEEVTRTTLASKGNNKHVCFDSYVSKNIEQKLRHIVSSTGRQTKQAGRPHTNT